MKLLTVVFLATSVPAFVANVPSHSTDTVSLFVNSVGLNTVVSSLPDNAVLPRAVAPTQAAGTLSLVGKAPASGTEAPLISVNASPLKATGPPFLRRLAASIADYGSAKAQDAVAYTALARVNAASTAATSVANVPLIKLRGGPLTTFDMVCTGQSNMEGNGESVAADLVMQPNILIWNDVTNAWENAVYGTYPLNHKAPDGSYNTSPCTGFANALRKSSLIPAATPIRLIYSAIGGKAIPNWVSLKIDPVTGATVGQYFLNDIQSKLNASGVTNVRVIDYDQGNYDAIGPVPDTFNTNGTYSAYGFGTVATNNAPGGTVNPTYPQFTFPAYLATAFSASGSNTKSSFCTAVQALDADFRAIPQVSPTTPIIMTELSRAWAASEPARNDCLEQIAQGTQLPWSDPYLGVISTYGATMSALSGNGNHYTSAQLNLNGANTFTRWLSMSAGALWQPLPDTGQVMVSVNGNIDNNGSGVTQGTAGSGLAGNYSLSGDQLRFGATVKLTNSTLVLQNANQNPGGVELNLDVWSVSSGPSYLASFQAIIGLNGGVQQSLTIDGVASTYWVYTLSSTGLYTLRSGTNQWMVWVAPTFNGLLPYSTVLATGTTLDATANGNSYRCASGAAITLPGPNAIAGYRIGIVADQGGSCTLSVATGNFWLNNAFPSTITLPSGQSVVFEALVSSRLQITGGTYLAALASGSTSGLWTPNIQDNVSGEITSTPTVQTGNYRINNGVMTASFYLTTSITYSSPTGTYWMISGLPAACLDAFGRWPFGHTSVVAYSSGYTEALAIYQTLSGAYGLRLRQGGSGKSDLDLPLTAIPSGSSMNLYGSITCQTS